MSDLTSTREVICERSHHCAYLGRGTEGSHRRPDRDRSRDRHRRVCEIPDRPLKQRWPAEHFTRGTQDHLCFDQFWVHCDGEFTSFEDAEGCLFAAKGAVQSGLFPLKAP